MFLLNNINGREHRKIYNKAKDQSNVIFDISDKQLNSSVNSDWEALKVDNLVSVVQPTYKMSTIYRIDEIATQVSSEQNEEQYLANIIRGVVAAKFVDQIHYSDFLSLFAVDHPRLKGNKFCVGFNVAYLGSQIDSAQINVGSSLSTIGDLKND